MATAASFLGSYSQIASEYYDARLHPTCANFREASSAILRRWFRQFLEPGMRILETGAGASVAAELRDELQLQIDLVLTDRSSEMLRKSVIYGGDRFLVGDAGCLPIANGSMNALIASLGDPYNTLAFWRECKRVLSPGAPVFFTTPAFEWANSFRAEMSAPPMVAEFYLAHGGKIFVPSIVLTPELQIELMSAGGLQCQEVKHVSSSEIKFTKPSPKLRIGELVTGFRANAR